MNKPQRIKIVQVLSLAVVFSIPQFGLADLIVNGDFEKDAIVGVGQSQLSPGQLKWIETDPNHSLYTGLISGVMDWTTPYTTSSTGVGTGLAKYEHLITGGSGDLNNQQLYMNTWNSIAFQEIDRSSLGSNYGLKASVDFGTTELNGSRGGWMGLFSDAAASYVDFVWLGNHDWTGSPLDFSVGDREFGNAFFDYNVTSADLSYRLYYVLGLQTSSTGPIYYDNASLTVTSVPEPGSCIFILGMIGLAARRRRSR